MISKWLVNLQLEEVMIFCRYLFTGESVSGEWDRLSRNGSGASGLYREVDGCCWYLLLHAQLQRGPSDLRSLRQQCRLSTEEDVGEDLKTGDQLTTSECLNTEIPHLVIFIAGLRFVLVIVIKNL